MRMHVVTITTLLSLACAHGSHSHEESVDPAEDWALYHMQEEHRKDYSTETYLLYTALNSPSHSQADPLAIHRHLQL